MNAKFSALFKGNRRSFITSDDLSRDEMGSRNKNLIDPLISPGISCLPLASFANRNTNINPAEGFYGR
jgi:hypothetical protein